MTIRYAWNVTLEKGNKVSLKYINYNIYDSKETNNEITFQLVPVLILFSYICHIGHEYTLRSEPPSLRIPLSIDIYLAWCSSLCFIVCLF